jgi:hypothetical protein
VFEAFRLVKANAGSAGVDKQSIAAFEENLKDNLYTGVRQFGAEILEKVHVFNSLRISWGVVVMARFSTLCIDSAVWLGLS